jgi:hypothetical protein
MVRPLLMSSKFQRSNPTAVPTVKKVSRPTILQLIVMDRLTPVAIIHAHHLVENSLYLCL